MNQTLPLIIELSKENKKLREKLTIAEQWIGREISDMQLRRTKEEMLKQTRWELYESEESIRERIEKYLGSCLSYLSAENITLLVESEINFSHLIRKKNLDGIMVSNLYQKILEDIFEEHITHHFRSIHKKTHIHPSKNDLIEKTLYKVIHDNFRLSLGKLFQIFQRMMDAKAGDLVHLFHTSMEKLPLYGAIDDPLFWELFAEIIETHAFGEKRHAGKVSFQDIQRLRENITGNFEKEGFLKVLLKHL